MLYSTILYFERGCVIFLSLSLFLSLCRTFSGTPSAEQEEARRIAEKGRPVLGEHSKLEVIIEESMAFKVHTH